MPTQYGKSFCVADAVLLRVSTHKEKWAIIAPTEDKAKIIMDYIIDRIFDDPVFSEQLETITSKEKLKQERSKQRITFRDGGEVRIYSGNASNTKQTKSALMGFGAPNIILDESGQIGDELYSTVKRMVGGAEGTQEGSFLLEIGNPVYRNHFHRTWFGDRYQKIFINDEVALQEGRYTQSFLDEMKEEAGYDWMYQCVFPDATETLPNGYRRLVNDHYVDNAYIDTMPELTYKLDPETNEPLLNKWGFKIVDDSPILGVDVSGSGSNETRLIVRFPVHGFAFVAKVMKGNISDEDLEEVADACEDVIREWSIGDYRMAYDAGGVGYGLGAIMRRRGYLVKAVSFGESTNKEGKRIIPKTFLNHRAFMYWEARKWLRADGGKLVRDLGFEEMKLVYYKTNATGKTQIEPKDEMIKRMSAEGVKVESPDTADALVLTFVDTSSIVDTEDIIVD